MMTADDIKTKLARLGSMGSIFVPEFTWGDLRIDGVLIEPYGRKIKGFEIKVSKADFYGDQKWQLYSKFCSSLSIVCPEGLIQPEEIEKPFGLLWICEGNYPFAWKKKPKDFNHRGGLAWEWRYFEVVETEFKRMQGDISALRERNFDLNCTIEALRKKEGTR